MSYPSYLMSTIPYESLPYTQSATNYLATASTQYSSNYATPTYSTEAQPAVLPSQSYPSYQASTMNYVPYTQSATTGYGASAVLPSLNCPNYQMDYGSFPNVQSVTNYPGSTIPYESLTYVQDTTNYPAATSTQYSSNYSTPTYSTGTQPASVAYPASTYGVQTGSLTLNAAPSPSTERQHRRCREYFIINNNTFNIFIYFITSNSYKFSHTNLCTIISLSPVSDVKAVTISCIE